MLHSDSTQSFLLVGDLSLEQRSLIPDIEIRTQIESLDWGPSTPVTSVTRSDLLRWSLFIKFRKMKMEIERLGLMVVKSELGFVSRRLKRKVKIRIEVSLYMYIYI